MDERTVDLTNRLDCITIFVGETIRDFRLLAQEDQIVLANRDFNLSEDWGGCLEMYLYPPVLYLVKVDGKQLIPEIKVEIPLTDKTISIKTTAVGEMKIKFVFYD